MIWASVSAPFTDGDVPGDTTNITQRARPKSLARTSYAASPRNLFYMYSLNNRGRERKMVEISWGKAFGYGLRFVVFIILWAIVGVIIAAAGGLTIAASANIKYNADTQQFDLTGVNMGGVVGGVIIIAIGAAVVILGAISSYFKLMSKLVTETVSQQQLPPPR